MGQKTSNLPAYWKVITTSAREDSADPKRMVVSILQLLGRILLIALIYKAAFYAKPNVGLSYTNTLWSIGVAFAFFINLGIRNIAHSLNRDIKSGDVETWLTKPLDWRWVKVCQLIGRNGVEFVILSVILSLSLWGLTGLPDVSHINGPVLVGFVVIGPIAVASAIAIFMMVGLSAFWLGDAKSLFRVVDKTAAMFCGAFVPIVLLPDVVQQFVRASPFGAYAAPTHIFNPAIVPVLGQTLALAALWCGLLWIVCQCMWRRAERKIEVNGG